MPSTPLFCSWLLVFVALFATATANASAQTPWWQRARTFRTRYYNVKTDLPEDEAKELATHVDIMANAYVSIFAGLRIRRPAVLDIYLFAEQDDYIQTVHTRFGTDATGSWGLCMTRGSNISLVAWRGRHDIEAMKRLLQHEGFHQFASNLFPRLPTWANEGLAEVFERGVAMNGVMVLGEVTATDKKQLVDAAASNRLRPFRDIFTMPSQEWGHQVRQGNARLNYLQAWSMTHFMLYADDEKYQRQFLNFLVALNRGLKWEQAFVASFGMPDFSVMEKMWREHIKAVAPTDYRETIRRLDFLAAGLLELHAQRIHVASIADLEPALQELDFNHESRMFGEQRVLRAAEARLYEVPYGSSSSPECSFQLLDSRGRKPKPRMKKASDKTPTHRRSTAPLTIVTDGIEPRDFKVRWKRTKAGEYQSLLEAR